MMLKRIIACVVGGLLFTSMSLQAQITDSLPAVRIKANFKVRQLYIPLVLLAGGMAIHGNGEESLKMELKEERDEYLRSFHNRIDDYLQFAVLVMNINTVSSGCPMQPIRWRASLAGCVLPTINIT